VELECRQPIIHIPPRLASHPKGILENEWFWLVLATVPVLDPAGFIGLCGNGLTPSKIDDFFSEPSLLGHKY